MNLIKNFVLALTFALAFFVGNAVAQDRLAFYQDPSDSKNTMCVTVETSDGYTEACGDALLKDYDLDFYMIHRYTADTIWLDPFKNSECRGTDRNSFTCYDGIHINMGTYSCGGSSQCNGNSYAISQVNYNGNASVYVRLMKDGTPQVAPLRIDVFKKEVHTRIVWGNVKSETESSSYIALPNSTTDGKKSVMAGVRVPIYVAVGYWDSPGFFTYNVEEGAGINYSLRDLGLSDFYGNGLRVYNKYGDRVTGSKIPANGIDTLWVEGPYEEEFEFRINVAPESNNAPDMHLTIYPPELRFVGSDYSTPAGGKGYSELTEGATQPPYVGTPLTMYIVAYDPKTGVTCETCNFPLTDFSTTNNDSINSANPTIIQSNVSTQSIVNGRATVNIFGLTECNCANFATWIVYGPNKNKTFAVWKGLLFRTIPVPIPIAVYIYDSNGDGIKDSLEIHYNKSLKNNVYDCDGNIKESLPHLIEVVWDVANKDTIHFHSPKYTVESLKNNAATEQYYNNGNLLNENREYWEQYLKNDSTIVISGVNFSKDALAFSEEALIYNWVAYRESDNMFVNTALKRAITDESNTPIISRNVNPITSNIGIRTTGNAIVLKNLPANAKVEVYNLRGEQVYIGNSGNSQNLKIPITKGMYIVKVGKSVFRIPVM